MTELFFAFKFLIDITIFSVIEYVLNYWVFLNFLNGIYMSQWSLKFRDDENLERCEVM